MNTYGSECFTKLKTYYLHPFLATEVNGVVEVSRKTANTFFLLAVLLPTSYFTLQICLRPVSKLKLSEYSRLFITVLSGFPAKIYSTEVSLKIIYSSREAG